MLNYLVKQSERNERHEQNKKIEFESGRARNVTRPNPLSFSRSCNNCAIYNPATVY